MPYVRWKDFIQMLILILREGICIKFSKFIIPTIDKITKLSEQNIRFL
mgnify:CR=1 FL=1